MNIHQVLEGVKKGRCYSRPCLKKGRRYYVKIVSLSGKPWIWSRSSIHGIYAWDRLNNVDELETEHREANDWVLVSKPAE